MTTISDHAAPTYPTSEPEANNADLDTVMRTAELIVRDILQLVVAGRTDDDARATFRDWIVEAMLAQPSTQQYDAVCRAAGFAGPVDPATMQARIDELHTTIDAALHELADCKRQLAALRSERGSES